MGDRIRPSVLVISTSEFVPSESGISTSELVPSVTGISTSMPSQHTGYLYFHVVPANWLPLLRNRPSLLVISHYLYRLADVLMGDCISTIQSWTYSLSDGGFTDNMR